MAFGAIPLEVLQEFLNTQCSNNDANNVKTMSLNLELFKSFNPPNIDEYQEGDVKVPIDKDGMELGVMKGSDIIDDIYYSDIYYSAWRVLERARRALEENEQRRRTQSSIDKAIGKDHMTESEKLLSMFMANPQHMQLLTHPVLASFLQTKWRKPFGPRVYFAFLLVVWFAFSVLLTTYICMAFGGKAISISGDSSHLIDEINHTSKFYPFNSGSKATTDGLGIALMVFTSLLFIWEVLQMMRHLNNCNLESFKKKYLKNAENWIQLFLISSTIAIISMQVTDDSRNGFNSNEAVRHLSALCIVLTWTLILFMFGNRFFSTYIGMFRTVAFTYFKLLFFTVLIAAYGLEFYIMLHR